MKRLPKPLDWEALSKRKCPPRTRKDVEKIIQRAIKDGADYDIAAEALIDFVRKSKA